MPQTLADAFRSAKKPQFVPARGIEQANFSTLQRVNASYVSESERQRHDDMVWRLKVGEQWVWVYLLLEFQSEPDPWMALRMMVYVGLLAQHLVREGELHDGLLPPVVPIVLYNGATPWKAHTDVADCFVPSLPGLGPYRPRLLYHLVDEARLRLHPMSEIRNLAEALFRLERSRTPPDIFEVMRALGAVLQGPQMQPLRRTITIWLRLLLRRKVPRANIAEIDDIKDLLEADAMLEQTIERWFDEATLKGVRQGMQQGEAVALQRLLARRFGVVPSEVVSKISTASSEQIDAWLDLVLDAPSLDALFNLTQH